MNVKRARRLSGQAAVEYLMVVGIAFLLLAPILITGNNAVSDLKSTTDNVVARDAVDKMAEMSRIVYAQGPPAKITKKISFPSNILGTTLSGQTIGFRIRYGSDYNDIVTVLEFNVTGTIPDTAGVHNMRVEAIPYGVNITEAT